MDPLEAGVPLQPEEAEGPVEAAADGDGAEEGEDDEALLEGQGPAVFLLDVQVHLELFISLAFVNTK